MNPLKLSIAALTTTFLAACSGMEVNTWEPTQFASGAYNTYSWRSEPIINTVGSRDPIYRLDPVVRGEVDGNLQAKGYKKVDRDGDFTIDYIYAPGIRAGVAGETTSNLSPRAGVRPNTSISGAERDNAIALSGVKETHNLALQINDGKTGMEVWRGVLTKIAQDTTGANLDNNRTVRSGIDKLTKVLPKAG